MQNKDPRVSALYSYLTGSSKVTQDLADRITTKFQTCIEEVRSLKLSASNFLNFTTILYICF